MTDDTSKRTIQGLLIFAIGVIIVAVGSSIDGASQTAAYLIGMSAVTVGSFVFIRGIR